MRMMNAPDPTEVATELESLLLRRAAAGDAEAFATLTRQLARPALALAGRVLGDAILAEDAVQEALTRLWREASRFDPSRGTFAAWWRRMLLNVTLDGRRRLRPVAPLDDAANLAAPDPDPLQRAEQADVAARVQAAMAILPPRQRAALSLFHGDGLSMAEIAEALSCSEKAVEGLLTRGRAELRIRLTGVKDDQ